MEGAYVNTSQTKNRISLHGRFAPSIQGDWIHDATDSAGCQAIDNASDVRIRGNFLFPFSKKIFYLENRIFSKFVKFFSNIFLLFI